MNKNLASGWQLTLGVVFLAVVNLHGQNDLDEAIGKVPSLLLRSRPSEVEGPKHAEAQARAWDGEILNKLLVSSGSEIRFGPAYEGICDTVEISYGNKVAPIATIRTKHALSVWAVEIQLEEKHRNVKIGVEEVDVLLKGILSLPADAGLRRIQSGNYELLQVSGILDGLDDWRAHLRILVMEDRLFAWTLKKTGTPSASFIDPSEETNKNWFPGGGTRKRKSE